MSENLRLDVDYMELWLHEIIIEAIRYLTFDVSMVDCKRIAFLKKFIEGNEI